ncbi:MAG: adenylate/guanylate cyclase domain-containing protein [Spirochaetota bacterium]|nr:adenylate/guanylate cyclase domain-containing protein [Spirochaetota bacterium]
MYSKFEFKRLLSGNIKYKSEHSVIISFDIRGFSSFSEKETLNNIAMFIYKTFMKIISDYFFFKGTFFKPMGDGLIAIIPYNESNVKDVIKDAIVMCWRLLIEFPSFFEKDPMITFSVPSKIGIGLTRGEVLRVISNNETIDCFGRVINLACRLADYALPLGIIFHESFGKDLLPKNIKSEFKKVSLYIDGIAELKPTNVYYTKNYTNIPSFALKQPWKHLIEPLQIQELGYKIDRIKQIMVEFALTTGLTGGSSIRREYKELYDEISLTIEDLKKKGLRLSHSNRLARFENWTEYIHERSLRREDRELIVDDWYRSILKSIKKYMREYPMEA